MKESEVIQQMSRITQYRKLEELRDQLQTALTKVTEDWATGPCGKGPFTGNTRESRMVQSMHIHFTPTRGGACAVEIDIPNIHIEAWDLGRALESMLISRLELMNAEMNKV